MEGLHVTMVFPDVGGHCGKDTSVEWMKVSINRQLNNEKHHLCKQLLQSFNNIFSPNPGKTDLAEFDIIVKDETPIAQRPYIVSHSRQAMKNELEALLKLGVIE